MTTKLKAKLKYYVIVPSSAKSLDTIYKTFRIIKQGAVLWGPPKPGRLESKEPFEIEYITAKGRKMRRKSKRQ